MRLFRDWVGEIFDEREAKRILFRVDAGHVAGVSFGHAARCVTFAKVAADVLGARSVFLMRPYEEGIHYVREHGFEAQTMPVGYAFDDESGLILEAVRKIEADWIVVDLPYEDINISYFAVLNQAGVGTVCIDDARYISEGADVVLNSAIDAPSMVAKRQGVRYFLGPKYFIFDAPKNLLNAPGADQGGPVQVVITFGGSDPTGLTVKAAAALVAHKWPGAAFSIITGPGFTDMDRLKEVINQTDETVLSLQNPDDIYTYFSTADAVVCAGGRTLYELHALGKKTMAVASTDTERKVIDSFLERGLLKERLSEWDEQRFVEGVKRLVNDVEQNARAKITR